MNNGDIVGSVSPAIIRTCSMHFLFSIESGNNGIVSLLQSALCVSSLLCPSWKGNHIGMK